MTNEFTVVGEHNDDATHLLVVGADGHHSAYDPVREQVAAVEPDKRWVRIEESEEPAAEPASR